MSKTRLRQIILSVLAFVFLCSTVFVIAFAHGGNTDSSGGHYDKSTGEYHYHHGYPAHQHKDLNGDGVIDCPYNFVDKTGQNSGSGGNEQKAGGSPMNFKPFAFIFFFCFVICLIILLKIKNKVSDLRAEINTLNDKYEMETKRQNDYFRREAGAIAKVLKDTDLYVISGAPQGVIVENGLPRKIDGSGLKYGAPYTVYVKELTSEHYHYKYGCSSAYNEANFFVENVFRQPCAKCVKEAPDVIWLNKYKKLIDFVEKYVSNEEE